MLRVIEHGRDILVAALRPAHLGQGGARIGRPGIAIDHAPCQLLRVVDTAQPERDQRRALQHAQLIARLQRLEQRVRLWQTTHALIQPGQLGGGEDVVEPTVRAVAGEPGAGDASGIGQVVRLHQHVHVPLPLVPVVGILGQEPLDSRQGRGCVRADPEQVA